GLPSGPMIDSSIPPHKSSRALGLAGLQAGGAPVHGPIEKDTLTTGGLAALRQALAAEPEIRPEALARGRALAADPNYPPASVLRQVASLLVASSDFSSTEG